MKIIKKQGRLLLELGLFCVQSSSRQTRAPIAPLSAQEVKLLLKIAPSKLFTSYVCLGSLGTLGAEASVAQYKEHGDIKQRKNYAGSNDASESICFSANYVCGYTQYSG